MEVQVEWATQNMVQFNQLCITFKLKCFIFIGGIGGRGGSIVFVAEEGTAGSCRKMANLRFYIFLRCYPKSHNIEASNQSSESQGRREQSYPQTGWRARS